jgi:hypothetical protein
MQMQKHPAPIRTTLHFWSPDGTMGCVEADPEFGADDALSSE